MVWSALAWCPWAESADLAAAMGEPCQVAQKMRVDFMYVAIGDILYVGGGACVVEACLFGGGIPAVLVRRLALLDRPSPTTSHWQYTEERVVMKMGAGIEIANCLA